MARLFKGVFIGLNAVTLLWSIASLIWGILAKAQGGNGCQNALQWPLIVTGAVLFVVSLLGLLGALYDNKILLYIYMALMVFLLIALIAFTIFAFVASKKPPAGKKVPPGWLQKKFIEAAKWNAVRNCLVKAKVCKGLKNDIRKWSPIQSGCCKPPLYCKLDRKDTLVWELPKGGIPVPDSDCTTYDNHTSKLCFECKSCKRGVLENVRKDWFMLAIINSIIAVFMIAIFVLSLCVKKDIEEEEVSNQSDMNFS